MLNELTSIVICAGLLSGSAYFGIGLYERLLLRKIPNHERPVWIPRKKFQSGLGHLAMMSGLGHTLAYIFEKKAGGGASILILMVAVFFFSEGIRRFFRASMSKT